MSQIATNNHLLAFRLFGVCIWAVGRHMWIFFGQLANFYNSLEYNYSLNIIMLQLSKVELNQAVSLFSNLL